MRAIIVSEQVPRDGYEPRELATTFDVPIAARSVLAAGWDPAEACLRLGPWSRLVVARVLLIDAVGMSNRIKIGLQLAPEQTTFAAYREAWLQADALGVDSLWDWDHFFPVAGDPHGPCLEGWTTLAVLGGQTRHATVGPLVLSMSYRNPALLSKMATLLDLATGGRLILGLGAGWYRRDYQEFGYPFGTAAERLANLERGIQIMRDRWTRDQPRPTRGHVPILIGGGGERVTLRIVARYADLWNAFGPAASFAHKNRILDAWCRAVGRDPGAIERTVVIEDDDLPDLDAFVRAGAQHLIYRSYSPFDLGTVAQLLQWRNRQNIGPATGASE